MTLHQLAQLQALSLDMLKVLVVVEDADAQQAESQDADAPQAEVPDAFQDADAQPAEVPDVFPDADAQEDAKHYKL